MNATFRRSLASAVLSVVLVTGGKAQSPAAGTLTVAGQSDQAPLLRVNGKSYIDVESLARILHGSISFKGTQTILTLPGSETASSPASSSAVKTPHLSGAYLTAEIEALAQLREWHTALANAIRNNSPVTDAAVGPLRRTAESKLQLAVAATSTDSDQHAAALLRNQFTAMQQLSDQFLAMQASASYIAPDSLDRNTLDLKVVACQQALVSLGSTKQFQDAESCH